MTEFLQHFHNWIGIIGILIVGGFAIYTNFSVNRKQMNSEQDKAEDRVINLLKEQVNALENKLKDQNRLIHEMNVKLEKALTENEILKQVLQGRDEESKEFIRRGLIAIAQADEILAITKSTNENMNKLTSLIEKHLNVLEQHVKKSKH